MRSATVVAVLFLGACGPGGPGSAGDPEPVVQPQGQGGGPGGGGGGQEAAGGGAVGESEETIVARQVRGLANGSCGGYCHEGEHFLVEAVGRPSSVPRLKLVEPGQPLESFLWLKVSGGYRDVPECMEQPQLCGERMPRFREKTLQPAEIELLRRWIELGAP